MTETLIWGFRALSGAALIGFPLYAWRVRGRDYGLFVLVILALSLPALVVLHARLAGVAPGGLRLLLTLGFVYGMLAAAAHLVALTRPRMRPTWFRFGVSIPGMAFVASGALAVLWLGALAPLRLGLTAAGAEGLLGAMRWWDLAPIALALVSIPTSLGARRETVRIPLAGDGPEELSRVPLERFLRGTAPPPPRRPLRIVQITDPHLGPWQSVDELSRRIAELLAREPDLVLLTGDFLTMEGMGTPGALARALAPLDAWRGRAFACLGNHDHEAPHEVRSALAANGIRLLVDDEALVDTPVGPVQILGADFVGRGRRAHLAGLTARFPRRAGHLRLMLLHDPVGFRHLPSGEVDLTLSGHTHGGQLGLVSLGLDWTVLERTAWPDHGLFALGGNRLYVHRGTGFYGFPVRVGVPAEASLLEVLPP